MFGIPQSARPKVYCARWTHIVQSSTWKCIISRQSFKSNFLLYNSIFLWKIQILVKNTIWLWKILIFQIFVTNRNLFLGSVSFQLNTALYLQVTYDNGNTGILLRSIEDDDDAAWSWFVIKHPLVSNDAVFYRTHRLLYHKFGNMVIFGSGTL